MLLMVVCVQNYEQIIDELKNRCKSRDNGTLFIKTEDNKSASIALERGVIVDCRFRHFKGMKAIELLRTVTSGKTSFSKDMVLGTVTDETLSTASVIELLSTTDTSTNKKVVEGEEVTESMLKSLIFKLKRIIENA